MAHPADGEAVDVTEPVVDILDRLTQTLDWGSGMFNDDELRSFFLLCDLLKFGVHPGETQNSDSTTGGGGA